MRRPLEGSYWTTLVIVLLALSPNIVVTTAYGLMTKTLVIDTGIGRTALRVFALIELLRAEADYVMDPIMRRIAAHSGIPEAVSLTLLIAIASTVLCVAVYLLSGLRPERPDLERYLEEGEPGLASPPLFARLRRS